jgi:hypothetical protein
MGMIPSDLATRLRSMVQSAVQPLVQASEIPSDLPDFRAGQRFIATIQSSLPDGTYQATVAGKRVTLSLAQGAAAGESLDLIVVDRTARSVVATRNPMPEPTVPPSSPGATLSRAAQLIGSLLAQGGERAGGRPGEAAALNRSVPILAQPSGAAQALAPLLKNAISESGVFYEAHQAQWLAGKRPLGDLLREPQGRLSPLVSQPGTETNAAAAPSSPSALLVRTADGELARQAIPATAQEAIPAGGSLGTGLPTDVAPVVRQQLEALSCHQIAWQGQIWPGQAMEWEIEDPPRDPATETIEAPTWNTTLRLALPNLGTMTARLRLDRSGVALDLRAAEDGGVEALRESLPQLAQALEGAGVPLRGSMVGKEITPSAGQAIEPVGAADDDVPAGEARPAPEGGPHSD